ncbi:LysR family transcriptional regulator [Pleomorphomonas carboxyditropha]|uniref:LysR family transcriptional regulator n=1 Tax=Pleomorphomonas carboxyditropha TaxID=2023338 RepID=A0A2G9WSX3_9HYPH|nr:LysR family transcriptional regulator [Pleomorphomonas carboxyditropha]PIO97392.1 LysR family transcriptional regulator [Pleomorphomonas carboxyditropha]
MDLKLLRSFVELVEAGHYGKAAARLCVTQSTLTKQIQALEAAVGGVLVERGRHGARPTALGELLLAEARPLIKSSEEADARLRRASAGLTGRLDIGFGISTLIAAPALIAGFRQRVPDCRITLDDMASRRQHERLSAGRLDVGFCRAPEADGELSFAPILTEHLALITPHGVALPAPDRLGDLNDLGFVALSPRRGPGLDAQIGTWCEAAGFRPRVVQQADDILTVHAVVAAGLGAALLPWHGVEALGGRTQHTRLSGKGASWPIGLCWRTTDTNPLLLRFIDHVRGTGGMQAL